MDNLELDATTYGLLMEIQSASAKAQQQAAFPYSNQMQGILQLVIRMNKLEGQWTLSEDGKQLVRAGN